MLRKLIVTLAVPSFLLAAAAQAADEPAAPEQDPIPRIIMVTPDLAGRMWFLAEDERDHLFVRACANSQPADCGPWSQVDIGWSDRIRRAEPEPEPEPGEAVPTVEGLLRQTLPALPPSAD